MYHHPPPPPPPPLPSPNTLAMVLERGNNVHLQNEIIYLTWFSCKQHKYVVCGCISNTVSPCMTNDGVHKSSKPKTAYQFYVLCQCQWKIKTQTRIFWSAYIELSKVINRETEKKRMLWNLKLGGNAVATVTTNHNTPNTRTMTRAAGFR